MIGFGDWRILSLLVVTIGLFAAFFVIEQRVAAPLINLKIFHNLGFTFGILSAMLVYACGYFNNVIMPFYLQDRLLLSSAIAGLILMAVPLLNIFSAPTGRHCQSHWRRKGFFLCPVYLLDSRSYLPFDSAFLVNLVAHYWPGVVWNGKRGLSKQSNDYGQCITGVSRDCRINRGIGAQLWHDDWTFFGHVSTLLWN